MVSHCFHLPNYTWQSGFLTVMGMLNFPAKLFGFDLALEPRTRVELLLYLEQERFVGGAVFLGPYVWEGMTAFDIGANVWIYHFAAVP